MSVHKSVLLEESLAGLNLKNGSVVVDATLGGGGHSREILKKILPKGTLVAIDQDKDAVESFKQSLKLELEKKKTCIVRDNFSRIAEILADLKTQSVDAIIADLGISSDQLEEAERGFSFQKNGPLDMRLDQRREVTARKIVNEYSEEQLKEIIFQFGEEVHARRIAQAIVLARKEKALETTGELVAVITQAVPASYLRKRINPATKTFQALRMEVNQELQSLETFLSGALAVLKRGGRLAVIAFHSGEDQKVKMFFRENARGCICPPNFPVCRCGRKPLVKIVNSRPIVPSSEEIKANPRSRSAKLRVIEKK